jgi:hypothetical protein
MTTQPTPPDNNACDALLRDLNKGQISQQMNQSFVQLVQAVRKHGKGGDLTLKLKIAPAQGGDANRVIITAAVTTKEPTNAPRAGIYYTTEEGRVQKNDPDQEYFNFRALPEAAPAPAPVAPPTAESAS